MGVSLSTEAAADNLSQSRRADRIRTLSRAMAALCTAASAALAAGMLVYWFATPSRAILAHAGLANDMMPDIGFGVRSLACLIAMAPLVVLIWGLTNARRCFDAFSHGRILSAEAVSGLRAFAMGVFASTLLQPIAGAALSVVLTWNNPFGKTLAFSVGSDTIFSLLFAGTIAVIAWVLTEAIAIAEENAQFV